MRFTRDHGWTAHLTMLGLLALLVPSTASAQTCVGDCDGSGSVTVDEIVTMVNIALGQTSVDACPAADPSGDGAVTVDEILQAVNNALNGCPSTGACTSALLTVSLEFGTVPLGGVTVEVDYPTASVDVPGSGNDPSVQERVMDITGAGGFFTAFDLDTNADSVDDQLRSSAVTTPSELPAGGFEVITFDCVSGAEDPIVDDFSCTVAEASDIFGNPVEGIDCSLQLMTE